MKNLKIRKYCKGDEKGFLALDRKLEEHKYNRRSISNFLWKYKSKNFFGKSVNYFSEYNNKIIAHVAVVITLIAIAGNATKPLMSAIEEGRNLGIFRVSLMILTSVVAMITFVKSFIEARKK